MSGERLAGYAVLITLRAVDSDLEFAVSKAADLPDEGRAYVEHVTTPDPLLERSGGSPTSSELAMACVSAHRAKRTYRSPARAAAKTAVRSSGLAGGGATITNTSTRAADTQAHQKRAS